MSKPGTIRVINMRSWGPKASPNECVVRGDRENPVLGNPYRMKDESERELAIDMFRSRLDFSISTNGELANACRSLAYRVANGENIALACWCKPLPCHLDLVVERVNSLVKEMQVCNTNT